MISFKGASVRYKNGIEALRGIDLEISEGEFAFIVGRSGAGKSSLIRLLTAEIKPNSGSVRVNGVEISRLRRGRIPHLRRMLGVVYQDFRLIDRMTVFENVAFAMRAIGIRKRRIARRVGYVLGLVGLSDKADSLPSELSGGEQQRVAIARALVNNPSVIIADEPTGNLDLDMSHEIMALLERINALGSTVIVITHDRELVERFAKRVITLEDGRVISDKRASRLFIDF
ncbi:MAG: cell division ATP-binding protein FtsE [Clostridia bacterium]|nr:cell division ATP-binding protein FtsE [Clostridia bacterium]